MREFVCGAPAILDRLQYVVVQIKNRSGFRTSKSFFVAVFALDDVGREIPNSTSMKFAFSDIYIQMQQGGSHTGVSEQEVDATIEGSA